MRHASPAVTLVLTDPQAACRGPKSQSLAGFVEPVVPFWDRFEKMASRAANLIEKTPFPDRTIEKEHKVGERVIRKETIKLADVQKRQAEFRKRRAEAAKAS